MIRTFASFCIHCWTNCFFLQWWSRVNTVIVLFDSIFYNSCTLDMFYREKSHNHKFNEEKESGSWFLPLLLEDECYFKVYLPLNSLCCGRLLRFSTFHQAVFDCLFISLKVTGWLLALFVCMSGFSSCLIISRLHRWYGGGIEACQRCVSLCFLSVDTFHCVNVSGCLSLLALPSSPLPPFSPHKLFETPRKSTFLLEFR